MDNDVNILLSILTSLGMEKPPFLKDKERIHVEQKLDSGFT